MSYQKSISIYLPILYNEWQILLMISSLTSFFSSSSWEWDLFFLIKRLLFQPVMKYNWQKFSYKYICKCSRQKPLFKTFYERTTHPTTLYQIEHRPVPYQKLLTDIQIDLPGSPNPKQLLYHPILHSKKNAQMEDRPKK